MTEMQPMEIAISRVVIEAQAVKDCSTSSLVKELKASQNNTMAKRTTMVVELAQTAAMPSSSLIMGPDKTSTTAKISRSETITRKKRRTMESTVKETHLSTISSKMCSTPRKKVRLLPLRRKMNRENDFTCSLNLNLQPYS